MFRLRDITKFNRCFWILLSLVISGALSAQQTLTVLYHEFDAAQLPNSLHYLGSLIPRQLMSELDFIQNRELTLEEMDVLNGTQISKEAEKNRTALADAIKKRDLIPLTKLDFWERMSLLNNAVKAISTAQNKVSMENSNSISDETKLQYEKISTVILHESNLKGLLLEPFSPDNLAKQWKNNELSVAGIFRLSGSWIILDVTVYSHALRKNLYSDRYYAETDDLGFLIDSMKRPIAKTLLNREYAFITLQTEPASTNIHLDGQSFANPRIASFTAGKKAFSVSHSGYYSKLLEADINLGSDYSFQVTLEPLPALAVSIDSKPSGSSVAVNHRYTGITPINLNLGPEPSILTISADGYRTENRLLRPYAYTTAYQVDLLPKETMVTTEQIALNKTSFLNSLGFFLLTLPVSVLSYGSLTMYLDNQKAIVADWEAKRITDDQARAAQAELYPKFMNSQFVFWPSLGASIILGLYSGFRLYVYISSIR